MEDIPVFICYGGRWDEKNNYVGYKVKGILIQENITYLKLLEILYAELALSPTEYSFSVKFDTKIPKAPPMDLDNDSDIRFFLRLKKGDKENNKYPLFVSINRQPTRSLEGTNQVFTMNPVLPSLPHMETDAKAPNDDNPSGSESLGKGGAYSITPEMGAIGLDGEPYFEKDHIAFNSPTAPPVETFQYGTNAVYMEQICNFNKTKNTVVGDQEALKRKKESARGFLTDFNVDDIKVNYLFKDKEFLKKCLSFIAMRNNFQYRVAKSDRKLVSLKCLNNDCKWTVRARRYKNTNMFRIVKYVQDHNCSLEPIVGDHKQASASLIGQCIKLKCLETGREYTPNDIMRDMQQKYGVTISYEKAWRARKMALDDLTGAPEDSYTHLPSFCYMLESKNPGTVTNIETDDHNRFKYLFVSFGASIRGWQYCRSVIVVDRTLLRVRNGRVLFMACAKDGNNEIFPLGFGIGDSENDASWEWFFRMLKEAIGDRDDLAIISDLNNSISSAVATVYPNAYHGLCMQHLKHTLKAKFKKIFLDDLFCSAAKAYRVCDFNYFMLEMEKLEPSIPTYIRELDPEKWACAFFPRCRYNIMTTDIADSLKAILEKAREYPVATLMEQLCCMIQRWFWDRKNIDAATLSPVTSWAENELKQKIFDSHSILVHPLEAYEFQVIAGDFESIVKLNERSCTCREFDLDQIPCVHALAAINQQNLSPYSFCSEWFKKHVVEKTYEESIHPVGSMWYWVVPDEVKARKVEPPDYKCPEIRKRQRSPSQGEDGSSGVKCGRCGEMGHNRKTCKNPASSLSRSKRPVSQASSPNDNNNYCDEQPLT